MRIRKFREEDAKKVCYLVRKNIREILPDYYPNDVVGYLYWENTVKRFFNRVKKRDYVFVIQNKKRIIGTASLQGNKVKDVYVNPIYHKKGLGKKLMEKIDEIAIKNKIKKLEVMSSFNAQPFYEKCGFKKINKFSKPLGKIVLEGIFMEKKLQ